MDTENQRNGVLSPRVHDGEEHVDEIMSRMQGTSKKAAIVGFGPLPMRMGVVGSRSGSRETYRGPRINKEGCLRTRILSP